MTREAAIMFEDREAYANAEAEAVEAGRGLDPELVAVEKCVVFEADAGSCRVDHRVDARAYAPGHRRSDAATTS